MRYAGVGGSPTGPVHSSGTQEVLLQNYTFVLDPVRELRKAGVVTSTTSITYAGRESNAHADDPPV